MGIFDNFLNEVHQEIRRTTASVDAVKSGTQKLVNAIDAAEQKINNLPSESDIKQSVSKQVAAIKKPAKDSSN